MHGNYQRLQKAYDQCVCESNERFARLYEKSETMDKQIKQAQNWNSSFMFNLSYLQLVEFYVKHLGNTYHYPPATHMAHQSPTVAHRPNPTTPPTPHYNYSPGSYGNI